jgi:hypothetical protein
MRCSYDASGNVVSQTPAGVFPPEIIGQPVRQIVEPGQIATFSVVIADAQGATFQWRRNGGDMAGETGDSLVRNNVAQSDDGDLHSVVVTNSAGSVTSASAALLLDSDGDGIPDIFFETTGAAGSETSNESELDLDHDGISNLDEFLEGTDTKTDTSQKPRLTVYSDAGGSVAVTPMKLTYDLGETVKLTATAFAPNRFVGWSGDLSGVTDPMANSVQLALTERQLPSGVGGIANRTVRARFATAVPPPPGLIALWRGETDASDSIGAHNGSFFDRDGTPVATPSISAAGKVRRSISTATYMCTCRPPML